MKRGWIAVIMIALSLICGGYEYWYVTANTEIYVEMLEDADGKMEKNQIQEAESVAQRLDYRFRKDSGTLNMFTTHCDTGDISCDLAMLQRYAQTGDTEEFLATSAKARREIMGLRHSKEFSIGNVF